jgi:ribose/xylose/arabinose/galactoside ABC-type transport system permease subunit
MGTERGAGVVVARRRRASFLRAVGPLLGLACVWGLFALLNGHAFIDWDNQRIMLLQTAVVGTAAIGATLIIVSGGLDLSVGSSIALGTMVVAWLLRAGYDPTLAALGGVASGAVIGLVIGSMVVGYVGRVAAGAAGAVAAIVLWPRLGVWSLGVGAAAGGAALALGEVFLKRLPLSPFIVTLGTWGALRGLSKGIGDNSPIYPSDLGWIPSLMSLREGGITSVLPVGVMVCLALALAMSLVMRATPFGVQAYAIGSNETAARACGIRLERTRILIYTLGVACAGVAAVLQFSYLSMGDPTTAEGYELRVIAAVVIGGASLSGGEGTVRGTLVGALIMTVVDNGCTKYGIENWVQEVVTGAIIVAAVALDRLRRRAGA